MTTRYISDPALSKRTATYELAQQLAAALAKTHTISRVRIRARPSGHFDVVVKVPTEVKP